MEVEKWLEQHFLRCVKFPCHPERSMSFAKQSHAESRDLLYSLHRKNSRFLTAKAVRNDKS